MQTEDITNTNKPTPYQYGNIWVFKGTEKHPELHISRVDVQRVAYELGFRLYQGELYRIIGMVLFPATERDFQDALTNYTEDRGDVFYKDLQNALDAYLQKNGKHTISRLPIIDKSCILKDTPTSSYKFFKNCWVQITPIEIFYREYKDFPSDKLILSTKIAQRDYNGCFEGKYLEFLKLATNWKQNEENIKSIIGFLSHEYKDETTGYIIVLTEQCPDPNDGGGSGKNVFCNLLSHTTTYHSKNGAQCKFDEKFFQSWNGQRIMCISDVPKNFPFAFLKEPSTGTFILKKLYKDEVEVPVEDGPKFMIQTNFSYEVSDGGLKRRIIPIEFTDFFTKAGGIDTYFGCHFPSGWSIEDWHNFDTIIINCIQTWLIALASKKKLEAADLTETGWEKQFENSYGHNLSEFIKDNKDEWIELSKIPAKDIQASLNNFYNSLDVAKTYRSSAQRVASAIKEYFKHYGYKVETGIVLRDSLGLSIKHYVITN